MNEKDIKRKSKFLSLILRHQPETVGIQLDESGWVDVETLLSAIAEHGKKMSRETLEHVVHSNDKQRFSFSDDG
ncbi:MAG: RNA 2'-phosphotransferase, partial [Gimesia chilikensis]